MATSGEGRADVLIGIARDDSSAGRRALVHAMTDLFCVEGKTLSDRERFLMNEIMRQLVHEVEISIRRELAERLASEPHAPPELVLALANDEIEVAFPVLNGSEVLQDRELIEIIHNRTQEHQLAIAMRRQVSGAVSEALVAGGCADVICTLLKNPNAEIKSGTLAYLVEESRRVDTFQNPLLHRKELTPDLAGRMYAWVSDALRQHIARNFDVDAEKLDAALRASTGSAGMKWVADARNGTAPIDLAERLNKAEALTPELLLDTLRAGEIALFRGMFARMTGLGLAAVDRLLFQSDGQGLAIACKAVGIPRAVFLAIVDSAQLGRIPPVFERSRVAGFFDKIKVDAALRVLVAWRQKNEAVHGPQDDLPTPPVPPLQSVKHVRSVEARAALAER